MPAQLVSLDDNPSIVLDKPILLLGRHPECDIQIDSRKISRRHCCIALVEDYLVVRDLGSTNGIRINGARVLEGRLAEGDELTIGLSLYRVTWDVSEPADGARKKRARKNGMPIEDHLLESSDDPVPLPDPGANRSPDKILAPPLQMEDVLDNPAAVLPEDLTLKPISHANLSAPPADPNRSA